MRAFVTEHEVAHSLASLHFFLAELGVADEADQLKPIPLRVWERAFREHGPGRLG